MAADDKPKIRLELLDGTVEVTGSEEFVRRAQALFMRLAGAATPDESSPPQAIVVEKPPAAVREPQILDITDIRSFKEQKQPRSAVEMATLVAYYVANAAPLLERKETITAEDLTRNFGHAGYPSSTPPRSILFQAKNAGYLDSTTTGEYKINPVGYNLVTAGLPSDGPTKRRRKPAKKSTKKASTKKK